MEIFIPALNLVFLFALPGLFLLKGERVKRHEFYLLPLLTLIILFIIGLAVKPIYIAMVNFFTYYAFFGTLWIGPFSVSFFLIASFAMERKFTKILLKVLAGIIFAYYLFSNVALLIPFKAHNFKNACDGKGVCLQSTFYTCGAASMVNLLQYYGIDTNEGEMAKLSRTVPGRGVGDAGILYAMDKKMDNPTFEATLALTDIEKLKNISMPVITTFKLTAFIDHAVVIERFEDGTFKVLDPMSGIEQWTPKELEDRWNSMVIFLKPIAQEE